MSCEGGVCQVKGIRLQTKIPTELILFVGFVGILLVYWWAKREQK